MQSAQKASVALSADGRRAVTVGTGDHLCIWDLEKSAEEVPQDARVPLGAARVDLSIDGTKSVAASSHLQTLQIHDFHQGITRSLEQSENVQSVKITPDNRRAITGGRSNLYIWDLLTGSGIGLLEGRNSTLWTTVDRILVTPDGSKVLAENVLTSHSHLGRQVLQPCRFSGRLWHQRGRLPHAQRQICNSREGKSNA